MPKRGSQVPSTKLDLPDTDPEATVEYMGGWHGLLPSTAGGGHRWTSITQLPLGVAYADDLGVMMDSIRSGVASLDELIYPPDSSKRQNLYHAVGVTKERPEAGKRGPASAVDAVPGAWADFDVRDGSFRDWSHILEIVSDMDHAGIGPQIIVSTGSGGAHCYWRAEGGLAPETGLMYSTRIRRWVQQRYGIKVDNVAQANRVMRLPGSIRFPKATDAVKEPVVVGMPRNIERYADLTALEVVTQDAWMAVEAVIGEERSRLSRDWERAVSVSLEEFATWNGEDELVDGVRHRRPRETGTGTWTKRYEKFAFEIAFNRDVTWDQVLLPAGWTKFGEPDPAGRQSWTRPGGGTKNPRSAVTDWQLSPHTMSLLSDARETGLSHLYTLADDAVEKRHKLTKVRVAAELYAGGSIEQLIRVWVKDGRGRV